MYRSTLWCVEFKKASSAIAAATQALVIGAARGLSGHAFTLIDSCPTPSAETRPTRMLDKIRTRGLSLNSFSFLASVAILIDSVFRRVEASTRGILTLALSHLILEASNLHLVCTTFSTPLVRHVVSGRLIPRRSRNESRRLVPAKIVAPSGLRVRPSGRSDLTRRTAQWPGHNPCSSSSVKAFR